MRWKDSSDNSSARSFTPASSGLPSCDIGHGSVWGVDYIQATTTAGGPRPKPRFAIDPNNLLAGYTDEKAENEGVVVFGVAVTFGIVAVRMAVDVIAMAVRVCVWMSVRVLADLHRRQGFANPTHHSRKIEHP